MRVFLLLLSLMVTAAQTLTAQENRTVQFINAIYHNIVPATCKYYYLLDTGSATYAKSALIAFNAFPYVTKLDSNFTIDIVEKFNTPDTSILWSSYHLKNAITVANNQADSMFSNERSIEMIDYRFYEKHKDSLKKTKAFNEGYAPVDFKWSKKRKLLVVAAYGDSLDQSIPEERLEYFRLSRPVFTDDDRYAMIWYGAGEHNYCLYIYRKEKNGEWKILTKIFCIC
jgi:hypothetical protein